MVFQFNHKIHPQNIQNKKKKKMEKLYQPDKN